MIFSSHLIRPVELGSSGQTVGELGAIGGASTYTSGSIKVQLKCLSAFSKRALRKHQMKNTDKMRINSPDNEL